MCVPVRDKAVWTRLGSTGVEEAPGWTLKLSLFLEGASVGSAWAETDRFLHGVWRTAGPGGSKLHFHFCVASAVSLRGARRGREPLWRGRVVKIDAPRSFSRILLGLCDPSWKRDCGVFSSSSPRRLGVVVGAGRVSFPGRGLVWLGGELGVVVEGFSSAPTWSCDSGV